MGEFDDRFACADCGEVLWEGPGEAPAEITALGEARLSCPACGSTARTGQSLATVSVGMSLAVTAAARQVVNVNRLVTGFVSAHNRFRIAAAGNRPGDTLYPLFEALNWCVAADARLTKDSAHADWTTGLAQCDVDLVAALRGARNVVHHRWETLLEGTWTGDDPRGSWAWQPMGQHALLPKGKARYGSTEYAATLQGQDVERSLDKLRRVLLAQTSARASDIESDATTLASKPASP